MIMTNGAGYIFHADYEDDTQLLQALDEFIQSSNTIKPNISKLGSNTIRPKLIGLF